MRPLIWEGEHCVAVIPLKEEGPAVGDLLVFKYVLAGKEVGVVHRLIEIGESDGQPLYITRGDNCIGCERVRRSDII